MKYILITLLLIFHLDIFPQLQQLDTRSKITYLGNGEARYEFDAVLLPNVEYFIHTDAVQSSSPPRNIIFKIGDKSYDSTSFIKVFRGYKRMRYNFAGVKSRLSITSKETKKLKIIFDFTIWESQKVKTNLYSNFSLDFYQSELYTEPACSVNSKVVFATEDTTFFPNISSVSSNFKKNQWDDYGVFFIDYVSNKNKKLQNLKIISGIEYQNLFNVPYQEHKQIVNIIDVENIKYTKSAKFLGKVSPGTNFMMDLSLPDSFNVLTEPTISIKIGNESLVPLRVPWDSIDALTLHSFKNVYKSFFYWGNPNIKSRSKNTFVVGFPIKFNNLGELNVDFRISGKSIIMTEDNFNYTFNFGYISYLNRKSNDDEYLEFHLPDGFYISDLLLPKKLTNSTSRSIFIKSKNVMDLNNIPLKVEFKRTGTAILNWIRLIDYFVFVVFVFFLVIYFSKYRLKYLKHYWKAYIALTILNGILIGLLSFDFIVAVQYTRAYIPFAIGIFLFFLEEKMKVK